MKYILFACSPRGTINEKKYICSDPLEKIPYEINVSLLRLKTLSIETALHVYYKWTI